MLAFLRSARPSGLFRPRLRLFSRLRLLPFLLAAPLASPHGLQAADADVSLDGILSSCSFSLESFLSASPGASSIEGFYAFEAPNGACLSSPSAPADFSVLLVIDLEKCLACLAEDAFLPLMRTERAGTVPNKCFPMAFISPSSAGATLNLAVFKSDSSYDYYGEGLSSIPLAGGGYAAVGIVASSGRAWAYAGGESGGGRDGGGRAVPDAASGGSGCGFGGNVVGLCFRQGSVGGGAGCFRRLCDRAGGRGGPCA